MIYPMRAVAAVQRFKIFNDYLKSKLVLKSGVGRVGFREGSTGSLFGSRNVSI